MPPSEQVAAASPQATRAKPVSYPTGAFRQRVLEATLRDLGAYGELTAAEVAFVKALDLPNLTLAALRDLPNIAPGRPADTDGRSSACRHGLTLMCLHGGGGNQAKSNASCVCCRGTFRRVRRLGRR